MTENLETHMEKSIESVRHQLQSIRTGRANPELLSRIQVEYYGTTVPLQQVATISVPEHNILMLNIFDQNAVKDIERAIQTSDLNLTPQTEGNIIRLMLPELTEERRQDLVKVVKKAGEDGKVAIRNIRRDHMDQLKTQEKNKELSEDEAKRLHDTAQKLTDTYTQKIDQLIKDKESELLTV